MEEYDKEKLIKVNTIPDNRPAGTSTKYCQLHRDYYHGSKNFRRKRERIVFKSGQINLEKSSVSKYRVFPDIVSAFVTARWRWTIFYCFLTFISTWLVFAGFWWLIFYLHGDLEPQNLPHGNNTWVPCVREIYDFTSIFLFSIEIHTTIGYGRRTLTLMCPEAVFVMCIESIVGTLIQSFVIGVVFAKLTRPKNRANTLMFSDNAVICQRDRRLSLIFRVGDTRKSRIIAASVQAYIIRFVTNEGNITKRGQIKLGLSVDSSNDIFFMFPVTVVHRIDEKSPLYNLSAQALLKTRLEILVVFEGIIESTGQTVQAKSSYISNEILWGHRFLQIVEYRSVKNGYIIDYSKFNETVRVHTPLCSAKNLSSSNSSCV